MSEGRAKPQSKAETTERRERKKSQTNNLEIGPDCEYWTLKTKEDGEQATSKRKASKLPHSAITFSSRSEVSHWPALGISCREGSGGNQLHSARVFGVRAGVRHQWGFLAIGTWGFYLQWKVLLSREHILFQKLLSVCVGMSMNMVCF